MPNDVSQEGAAVPIAIRRILWPTDFSDLSLYALRYARNVVEVRRAELHCVHVVDEGYQYLAMGPDAVPIGPPIDDVVTSAEKHLGEYIDEHLGDADFPVLRTVVSGQPFHEIILYARQHAMDLIVLGTHGRSGLKHALLGSVAEKVVRKAPCPVLSIRHPDHEFEMP